MEAQLNDGQPLVLRPSRKGTVTAFGIGLLFTIVTAVLLAAGDVIAAFVIGLLAIVGIGAGIAGLTPRAAHLRLDDQGYEVRSPIKSWQVGWGEIDHLERAEVRAGRRGTTPVVTIVFREGFERQHLPQTRLGKLLPERSPRPR